MKLRTEQTMKYLGGLLLVLLVLTSCSPALPEGQIKGTLVRNGKPRGGLPISITTVPNSGESTTGKLYHTNADDAGNFSYEGKTAGTYMLLLANPGGGSYNVVLKGGAIYTFDLPEGRGVDLGQIEISSTRLFP